MSNESTATLPPEVQDALLHGAIYDLLAIAFNYPDQETLAGLASTIDAVRDEVAVKRMPLLPLLDALAAAVAAADPDELAATHNALFAGEVPCSPCETEYDFGAFAKSRQLADIAGFYSAFGLRVAEEMPGPADFIATELEFLSNVVRRQAYAQVNDWDDRRELCAEAEHAFLEDHVGRWAPNFCRNLAEAPEANGFYQAAAVLCGEFVAERLTATGAHPRLATPRPGVKEDEETFTCPFAAPEGDEMEVLS